MLSIYDEKTLGRLVRLQKERAWGLDAIDWDAKVDLSRPLLPLDDGALFFPGASDEERLAISQMMGLIVAASICGMEECLLRLKPESFDRLFEAFPVNPEFRDFGEQFFVEERKHSRAFRRYLDKFCDAAGIDAEELEGLLPLVEGTRTERMLERELRWDGQAFWWIVATVEEEFLSLHRRIVPFEERLEPLYVELHRRHFEEEARHSPFPYLMLELIRSRPGLTRPVRVKTGLLFAQFLLASWSTVSLARVRRVKDLRRRHPMFEALASAYKLFEKQPPAKVLWRMITGAPHVSSLVNPSGHPKVLREAGEVGALSLPLPGHAPERLVGY